MKAIIALAALLAAGSASAQSIFERAGMVAGPGLAGIAIPGLGKTSELAAPRSFALMSLGEESQTLYAEAKAWADKIARVDGELDGFYDAYRANPSKAAAAKIEESRKERAYYASVWHSIVDPAKDFQASDPRINPILQALYVYLTPLPARVEKLETGKTAAAKKVESARDSAHAESARLYEDDRKVIEELGLSGKDYAAVEALIASDRKESKEYMGWVKSAYDKTAAWAKAVRINESYAEQYSWVYTDYADTSKLAKSLMDKKLGPQTGA